MKTQSSPILVPPPPMPPGRVAAGFSGDQRQPSRRETANFLAEVWREIRRIDWPQHRDIVAATVVILGLLGFFVLYLYSAGTALSEVLRLMGCTV